MALVTKLIARAMTYVTVFTTRVLQ